MTDDQKDFPDLEVDIGNIHLKNPVITCSGTFASGLEYSKFYDISVLGALTTKSYSLKKKIGNPPPRIWETHCGMLNSIGLQNEGIDFFINSELQKIKDTGVEIILSIFGKNVMEFLKVAKKVARIRDSILAIELNFSCPNVDSGGMVFCEVPEQIEVVTRGINEILGIPLIAKLSPNCSTIIESAEAAKNGGAEAVSLINTLIGAAFDIDSFKPRLGNITGGLSGPAIKPVGIAKVYELGKENIIPIIGMGGIYSWEDAVEYLIAGASAVGIGTANFIEIEAGLKVLSGIRDFMLKKNIRKISELTGIVFRH